MNDDGTSPASGDFEDPSRPLKVIMVFVADGGWHLQTVLVRVRDNLPVYLGPWSEPWSAQGTVRDWEYLEERIVEGRGGHGQAFEVEGFAAAIDANAGQVVVARATEVVASRGGPLGEVAMAISVGGISMPFVVLFDEKNDLVLVATNR